MGLALVAFAVAAIIAVVQATGSEDAPGPASEQQAVAVAQQSQPTEVDAQSAPSEVEATAEAEQQDEGEQTIAPQVAEAEQQERSQAQQAVPQEQQQQSAQSVTESEEADNPLRGFIVPIRGACVTEFEGHLPEAARSYRNDGVHEGLDFYQWASCTEITVGTEILAAKAGVVVRADVDYVDITPADWARFQAANWEGDEILDELRGRQVWIDHGRGIVTRYAHLSEIADGIVKGVEVQQGQVIGYPGESGQQEVYANPGTDIHLHFEIRVGSGWLGQGRTPLEARDLYLQAFGRAD